MGWKVASPKTNTASGENVLAPRLDNDTGWRASLSLRFARDGERTLLRERHHLGPLRVQRPFYPEGPDVCHLYVLHPPGGVVGGDRLEITGKVSANARALLTTPAAGKFYTSAGPLAVQYQQWTVDEGGALEWLPQENIIYDGARAALNLRVDLAPDAHFLGWEVLCFGRPASKDVFLRGALRARLEIWRAATPLYIERSRFEAGSEIFSAKWGLAQQCVTGTLLCTGDYAALLDSLRVHAAVRVTAGVVSLTQLPGLLVCRYLGSSTEEARGCFWALWEALRPVALGRKSSRPRIWDT